VSKKAEPFLKFASRVCGDKNQTVKFSSEVRMAVLNVDSFKDSLQQFSKNM